MHEDDGTAILGAVGAGVADRAEDFLHADVVARRIFAADVPVVVHIAVFLEHGAVAGLEHAGGAARGADDERTHAENVVDHFIGVDNLFEEVFLVRIENVVAVAVAVVADGMAFGEDALEDVGVRFCHAADDIEGGVYAALFQDVEDGRRVLRVGAVVKGQVGDIGHRIGDEVRHLGGKTFFAALGERIDVVDGRLRVGDLEVAEVVTDDDVVAARRRLFRRVGRGSAAVRCLCRRGFRSVVFRMKFAPCDAPACDAGDHEASDEHEHLRVAVLQEVLAAGVFRVLLQDKIILSVCSVISYIPFLRPGVSFIFC